MATKKVLAYTSESAKKVFRNQYSDLVPLKAKRCGTVRGRRQYSVEYRKRR